MYKPVYIMEMTRETKRASIGVTAETSEKVKRIIAVTGEKHYRMIDRVISKELARLERMNRKPEDWQDR